MAPMHSSFIKKARVKYIEVKRRQPVEQFYMQGRKDDRNELNSILRLFRKVLAKDMNSLNSTFFSVTMYSSKVNIIHVRISL